VDNERVDRAGGYHNFAEALAASMGALATLLAVKEEYGFGFDASEQDIVDFIISKKDLSDELDTPFYRSRRAGR
jgi:hypothetical protein